MAQSRVPALTASALVHGGLFALAFLALPKAKLPELIGQATPVTVVSSAPEPDVRPAVKAPEPAPAAAEEPSPSPEPPAAVETPAPSPRPPPPSPPKPKAVATPRPPQPAPPPTPAAKPAPRPKAVAAAKPELDLGKLAASLPAAHAKPQALDLAALAAAPPGRPARAARSLDLDALAASPPPGGARTRGPARAETAPQARPAVGAATGLSADELGALRAKLIRLWNPNCGVEGAGSVIARVRIRLAPDGSLAGPPELLDTSGEADAAVIRAASTRAVSAVNRGAPYSEIPRERLKTLNDIVFKFDAKQACR